MSDRIEGLSIGLGLDTLEIERGLTGLRDRMRTLNAEMRNNLSNFDRSDQSIQKYETRIDSLNKKVELQERITKSTREEYQKMVREHGEGSKEAERAKRAYEQSEGTLNNLKRSVENTTKEMEEFRREQERLNSGWNKAGEAIEATGKNMVSIGDGMKKTGKTLSTYVTAPLVGLGTVALTTGVSFEDMMAKVSATSGATGSDLEALEEKAREMGATTRFSASEAGEALYYMSLAGWDTQQMLGALEGVMSLAAASGEDLGTVSDIVTDALTAFGLQAEESGRMADVLAAASSNANTDVSGMGGAFQYVAPIAGSLGFTIEDTAVAIGLMADNGIKGQKAGTQLRSMMTRLVSPTGAAADTIEELGIQVANADGTMRPLDDIMQQLRDTIGHLDEEQQAQVATTLFGQEAMSGALSIINTSEESYDNLSEAVAGAEGSAKRMADTMEDTTGGSLRELKSMLEEVSLQLFDQLAPAFGEMIERVKEGVQWFSDLSDETKENIVQWGALAAAIGPVLVIGGTLISSIGKLLVPMGSLLKLIAAKGGLVAALTGPAGLLAGFGKVAAFLTGPWGLAIGAGVTAGIGLYNYFKEDAIPVVGEFGDEVSDTTAEAINEFQELHENVTTELSLMFATSQEVTEEGRDAIVGAFGEMYEMINGKQEEEFAKNTETLQTHLFMQDGIIDEEEQKILSNMERNFQQRQESLDIYYDRVEEIMSTALEEGRELTEWEEQELLTIQKRMQSEAIRTLSASEEEQLVIKERLSSERSALDARSAAETVKRSKETRDAVVAEAEAQYEETIAAIVYERDVTGSISKEKADELIAQAQRQKNESVKEANNQHDDIIALAQSQAEEHINAVDWETGEVLSKWKVFKRDLDSVTLDMSRALQGFLRQMGRNIRGEARNLRNDMAGVMNGIIEAAAAGLNGISKAVEWVADRLGLNIKIARVTPYRIPMSYASSYDSGGGGVNVGVDRMYAHGTDHHPGGPAVVGDGGMKELILYPNGHVKLSPDRDTLMDLPRGTQVVSGPETKDLMEQFGVPHYARGIGSVLNWAKGLASKGISALSNIGGQIWDWAVQGGKTLLGNVLNRMGISAPTGVSGALGEIVRGVFTNVRDAAFSRVDDLIPDMVPGAINFGGLRKTSGYGPRKSPGGIGSTNHRGVDYAGPLGSPIASQTAGRVAQAGYHNIRGNFVRIKQGIYDYMYQHNLRNLVSTGQAVNKGQNIATLGSTGASTGPHLHFEIWRNGTPINPEPFIGRFADGGLINNNGVYNLAEEGWPEYIIPTDPSKRTNAMKLLALAAKRIQGNKKPSELPNPTQTSPSVLEKLLETTMEQNRILKAILEKDISITREAIAEATNEQNAFDDKGVYFA